MRNMKSITFAIVVLLSVWRAGAIDVSLRARRSRALERIRREANSKHVDALIKEFAQVVGTPGVSSGIQKLIDIIDDSLLPSLHDAHDEAVHVTENLATDIRDCDIQHKTGALALKIRDYKDMQDNVQTGFDKSGTLLDEHVMKRTKLEQTLLQAEGEKEALCCKYSQEFGSPRQLQLAVPVVKCDFFLTRVSAATQK